MNIERKPFADLIKESVRASSNLGGVSVTNPDGDRATIRIYDIIGWPWIEAVEVADALDEITAPEIEVQIASPGGSVFEGIAIFNALRAHDARIITRVDSMAASVASVVAQAGDERIMLTASQMMIHEAWTITWGSADDIRKDADILDKQTDIIAGVYAERSGGDKAAFREMMRDETWFTATEAVEAGLADEAVTPARQDPADVGPAMRFSEQASSVVTEVERLTARAEEVIAFRSEQGKPPLSEDSVEAFQRIEDAAQQVIDVITSTPADEESTDDLDQIYYGLVETEHQEELV